MVSSWMWLLKLVRGPRQRIAALLLVVCLLR